MSEELQSLGLNLVLDFITSDEEVELVGKIKKSALKRTKSRNSIQRYGSSAPYKSNMVSATIPDYLDALSEKIFNNGLLQVKPNSVTINEYFAGQCITPHVDSKESGPIITILSLLSEAKMIFILNKIQHSIILPPRSVVQMKGELRTKWQHSIEPVTSTRYSIVFRNG